MYAAFRGLQFIYRAESLPSIIRMQCIQTIGKPFTSYIVVRGSPSGRHNARVGYPQVDGQYLLRQRRIHNLNRIGFAIYLDSGCADGYTFDSYGGFIAGLPYFMNLPLAASICRCFIVSPSASRFSIAKIVQIVTVLRYIPVLACLIV